MLGRKSTCYIVHLTFSPKILTKWYVTELLDPHTVLLFHFLSSAVDYCIVHFSKSDKELSRMSVFRHVKCPWRRALSLRLAGENRGGKGRNNSGLHTNVTQCDIRQHSRKSMVMP